MAMKIRFVNIINNFTTMIGVIKKIRQFKKAADEMSVDFHFVIYKLGSRFNREVMDGIEVVAVPRETSFWYGERSLFELILEDSRSFDAILMREPLGIVAYHHVFKRWSGLLVSEHHTKIHDELKSLNRPLDGLKRRFFDSRSLNLGRGAVALTFEIEQDLRERGFRGATKVIDNGVDVSSVPFTGFSAFNDRGLELVFLAGSFWPWHGIDRLVEGLRSYRGAVPITLHLIGSLNQVEVFPDTERVRFVRHGKLEGEALDDVMVRAHLGISTLGLHRKGMKEACSLKSREYLARGLPFVSAYDDPVLTADLDFCLRVPASDQAIDPLALIRFSKKMSATEGTGSRIRRFAEERVDFRNKVADYESFIKSLNR